MKMHKKLKVKGKVFKVALKVCMQKMLTIMNALIREKSDWKDFPINVNLFFPYLLIHLPRTKRGTLSVFPILIFIGVSLSAYPTKFNLQVKTTQTPSLLEKSSSPFFDLIWNCPKKWTRKLS